jgi:hypothetical protein
MVTIVRRLFGVRTYETRSYEISSCHIAKVLRSLSPPVRSSSLNERPTKSDTEHRAGASEERRSEPATALAGRARPGRMRAF